jgi:hypothetical protein
MSEKPRELWVSCDEAGKRIGAAKNLTSVWGDASERVFVTGTSGTMVQLQDIGDSFCLRR